MCKMCFREIWHLGLPFFLVSLRMIYYIFSTWKMQERMQYTLNYYGTRFFIMVQFFFNIYIVSLSWLNCSIVIALVFCKFLCFICNKIKCVTGLLFYKIHVFLFWTEHRGEGWGSGHSTQLPSIWPGLRSYYVRHIWVRDRSLFIAWGGKGHFRGGGDH